MLRDTSTGAISFFKSVSIRSLFSRRVSAAQDLPLVGQAVAGQRVVPAVRRPGRAAAAARHAARVGLQRVYPALLRHARDRHGALRQGLDRHLLQHAGQRDLPPGGCLFYTFFQFE